MKRYVFLICMIFCLSFTNTYAVDETKETIPVQVIEQTDILSYQMIVSTQTLGIDQTISSQEVFEQKIKIVNHSSYDLQMNQLDIKCQETDKDIIFSWSQAINQGYPIAQYQDSSSQAYQFSQKEMRQQRLLAGEEMTLTMQFQVPVEKTNPFSLSQIDIRFQFQPIFIQGYLFIDANRSGSMDSGEKSLSQMKINLWQDNNLIDTTQTDENGYYQFFKHEGLQQYYLETECPAGYTLIHSNEQNHLFMMQQSKLITHPIISQETSQQYSLGLIELRYKIRFFDDKKMIDQMDKSYIYQEKVVVETGQIPLKEGYTFVGWNTLPDGSGKSYVVGDEMMMPNHDVNLYSVWQKIGKTVFENESHTHSTSSQLQVQTYDDTHITIFIFLLLISFGSFLVMKSLKKK